MTTFPSSPPAGDDCPNVSPKPKLNIFLAYADFETALRGKRVHDQIVKDSSHEFSFGLSLWKFEVLKNTKLRAVAASEAADAALLIIATHHDHYLPRAVRACLEAGLKQKRHFPAAIVALLDGEEDPFNTRATTCAYLGGLAEQHHLDFFAHTGERVTKPEATPTAELTADRPFRLEWDCSSDAPRAVGACLPLALA
jgi:hypothetical protein